MLHLNTSKHQLRQQQQQRRKLVALVVATKRKTKVVFFKDAHAGAISIYRCT
jgi:hypothetical protein